MSEVKIACESTDAFLRQTLVSNVTRPAAFERDCGRMLPLRFNSARSGNYHQDAIVPGYPRPLNSDSAFDVYTVEQHLIKPSEMTNSPTALELFSLRQDEAEAFMRHADACQAAKQSGEEIEPRDRALKSLLGSLSLQKFLTIDESWSNMLTTTLMDREARLRHGLHLDDWAKVAYSERHHSPRRIGLNLGPGDRYLVAAFPDAFEIAYSLGMESDERIRARSAVWPYADDALNLANMKCFWFRLQPGEGYVAPTEVLVHDGSTLEVDQYSRIAFWLGQWPVGAFPSKYEPAA